MNDSQHRVLLVTGAGASEGAVTPVLAALEASDLTVRAIDIGRAGGRGDGVLDWVMRPFSSDVAERRLLRELQEQPPDVAVTFDPAATSAMSTARDQSSAPAPVIAVVNELAPSSDWGATDADRYLAIDDTAAVALADLGIEGERILTVGPICEYGYALAGQSSRADMRARFKIGHRPVVLIQIEGFGYEMTSQIALQLSLIETKALFLFDAGADADAATALRRQVPTLGLDAKLFGQTEDAPRLWRTADIIVARPTEVSVARALVVGALMVAFEPEGAGAHLATAMEDRRLGVSANNALLLSSALTSFLGKTRKDGDTVGADGAATVADIAAILAAERHEVVEERRSAERASTRARVDAAVSAAEAAARTTAAAGGLEDLSGGSSPWEDLGAAADAAPDTEDIARLKTEVSVRISQTSKTVSESHKAADMWARRAETARKQGDEELARKAERAAEGERARMHAALAEMAELQAEVKRLEQAAAQVPPASRARATASATASAHTPHTAPHTGRTSPPRSSIDAELADMKRTQTRSMEEELRSMKSQQKRSQSSLDDELAALKRKMQSKKK